MVADCHTQEKIYQIALSKIQGIGSVWFKKLMNHFGTAEALYHSKRRELLFFSKKLADSVLKKDTVQTAINLLRIHEEAGVKIYSLWDDNYPARLKEIPDAPTLLYFKGNGSLSSERVISIVGTRQATPYGKAVVDKIIQELLPYHPIIISGFAYGIDIQSHKSAMQYKLPTLAVLASGLDIVYPASHYKIVPAMCAAGGFVSEFPLKTPLETYQFPMRNRIIAGLADLTIVIEGHEKSGSLITARFANEYHREVFAVPGNIVNTNAMGCNHLIKTHQAHLLTSGSDIAYMMNWYDVENDIHQSTSIQYLSLMDQLSDVEQVVVKTLLQLQEAVHIDVLSHKTDLSLSQLSALLLKLELQGIVCCIPGKLYQLVR